MLIITSSTSESETLIALCPNSSTNKVAVSMSIAWFFVTIIPFVISFFTKSADRSAILLASSCTVRGVSGIGTSLIIFSLSKELSNI